MIQPPDDLPDNLRMAYYRVIERLLRKVYLHDDNADVAAWILFKLINKP